MANNKLYMQLIFLTALIATLGSLYFSEVRQYVPCEFCWYQRILMYPLVIISIIGFIRNDHGAKYYIRVMSGLGILIAAYHYALQKISFLGDNFAACTGASCTVQYINGFGFITIPFLSLIAFILIFILSFMIKRK
ncbi:disulfide oxidoreductase [Salinicoccus bachuensis]|uniref:Disulfide oxidoreductase n=1 Tax=Salinicoccus bachuensis TaxID=3136731 RepID=A0ABZ3CI23_9STAP